ncbi:hypothetical protein MMC21_003715 [Puttea exsequens]|nr:hypothetical protein [Puttea exsequens]
MPGIKINRRNSLLIPYDRSLYTPMSSRETFESRQTKKKSPKNATDTTSNAEVDRAWPVPALLKRSGKPRSARFRKQSFPLSPITEKRKSGLPGSQRTKNTLRMVESSPRSGSHSTKDGQNKQTTDAVPKEVLHPKPLFHSKRSLSYSNAPNIVPRPKPISTIAGLYVQDFKEQSAQTSEGGRPRSHSLHARQPSVAPTQGLPPLPDQPPQLSLPWELRPPKSQKRLDENRSSARSTASVDSSSPGKKTQRGFSQLLSIGIPSSAIEEASAMTTSSLDGSPSKSRVNSVGRTQSISVAKATTSRPPMVTQRSFQADLHNSVPESINSSLSNGFALDLPCKAEPTVGPIGSHLASACSHYNLAKSTAANDHRRERLQSASLSGSTAFRIHEDSNSKRLSSPVLQPTSGNQQSSASSPITTVRSSVVTDTSYDWDVEKQMPSARDRTSVYRRQNYLRINTLLEDQPQDATPYLSNEQNKQSADPEPTTIVKREQKDGRVFRPPSLSTFDPNLAYSPGLPTPKQERQSPRLFRLAPYQGESSPEVEFDTPTRKPSRKHPNRYRNIFNSPNMSDWQSTSSLDANPAFTINPPDLDPSKPLLFSQSFHHLQSQPDYAASTSSSIPFSFSIPLLPSPPSSSPPRRLRQPNWRPSKTQIRHPVGPRPMLSSTSRTSYIPVPLRSAPHRSQSSSRRSPVRGAGGVLKCRGAASGSGKAGGSPNRVLQHVGMLRRMDSQAMEAAVRGSVGHKCFQSIGENVQDFSDCETFGEKGGTGLEIGKENEIVRVNLDFGGERLIGKEVGNGGEADGKMSTESNRYNEFVKGPYGGPYDEQGFLKEEALFEF